MGKMFLIRTAFWLSLVILCLPAGPNANSDARAVGAGEALSAAQTTLGDLSKFCQRNAATCETGGMVISSFGHKARYGAQVVYEYLDEKFGSDQKAELTSGPSRNNS
jgi:hypothetical protein